MFWRKSRKPTPAPVTALQPSALTSAEPDWGHDDQGRKGFQLLRQKWSEVPLTSQQRVLSQDLAHMADEELHRLWSQCWEEQATGHNFDVRGWYYTLYRDQWRGKRIIDIGSGLGYDAMTFAGAGAAEVMCIDLAPTNLEVIRRIATGRGLPNVRTLHMEDFRSLLQLDACYDVVWACGSLINAPFAFTRAECQELLQHLKPEGRWVELAYPRIRWQREGRMPFDRWGEKTDGGAPWMEWKDLDKLLRLLAPRRFEVVLTLEFHNSDFNWFDLLSID
jgi:2-polyprenyl-3-methyl-5-hydroxy-6-metoxy-1,4-benzoquinol methylase